MSSLQGNGGIFISYRREEAAGHAGRLYDRLCSHFGADRVFMDVDSIVYGDDFTEIIKDKVTECNVLLVVIGQHWLNAADGKRRRRRIDNPDDWVRIEIETALQANIRIVPVLVDGAKMPQANDLPTSLQPLARRHAFILSHAAFQVEVAQLIAAINKIIGAGAKKVEAEIADEDEVVDAEIIDDVSGYQLGENERGYYLKPYGDTTQP